MVINLSKGQKINLSKEKETLNKITVGLGWDPATSGRDIDVDASILLLDSTTGGERIVEKKGFWGFGKTHRVPLNNVPDHEIVYFGHQSSGDGAVKHAGDNLTGEGEGDDEQIFVELQKVNPKFDTLSIVVNIYDAFHRSQDFGEIQNAYVHIMDDKGHELVRYNLTESYEQSTGILVGELKRAASEWEFKAVGEGIKVSQVSDFLKEY